MKLPLLIFSYGNPSRGDDAIGPVIHERLMTDPLPDTETLTDFQLQIEHTEDLTGKRAVIFVDACQSSSPPFAFQALQARQDNSYTSHAMSPEALLSVYLQVNGPPIPLAYSLSVRGYEFELGQPLSSSAQANLELAHDFLRQVAQSPTDAWPGHIAQGVSQ